MSEIPDLLLPYQKAWVADLTPVKICEKSRRVGLSWCEAADDVLLAATEGKAGMDCWYIGYNKDMALEFINDCAGWVSIYGKAADPMEEVIVDDEDKQILAFRIRFNSGHRITALSSRPSNLRGKQGKVVIDEAAFHDDLAELLKAAIALLMWGGRVAIISTHNGEENAFNELINEVRAGKRPYSLHHIDLDEALEQGLYRRICTKLEKVWTPEEEATWRQSLVDFYGSAADEELFCIPSKGSGVYFSGAMVGACMDEDIPVIRWACKPEFAEAPDYLRLEAAELWCLQNLAGLLDGLPQNYPCYYGEDFGRTGDLTVIVPLQEQKGLTFRAPFVVELRNVPFRQQEQVLFFLADRLPRFSGGAMDSRGNGQYLAEVAMQRYGSWRINQVMLSEQWYRENMPPYRAALEDRSILLPKDGDILDDHRAVRMERGIAKVPETYRGKGRDGGQRHGDSAIACALAWSATKLGGGPVEYEPVESRRMNTQRGAY